MNIIAETYQHAQAIVAKHGDLPSALHECASRASLMAPHAYWKSVDWEELERESKAIIDASIEILTKAQTGKPKLLWGGIGDVGEGMRIRSVKEWSGSLSNDDWMFGDTPVGSFLRSDQMKKILQAAGDFNVAEMNKGPAYIVELFVSLVYFGMILKLAKRRMGDQLGVPLGVGHPDSEEIFLVG